VSAELVMKGCVVPSDEGVFAEADDAIVAPVSAPAAATSASVGSSEG